MLRFINKAVLILVVFMPLVSMAQLNFQFHVPDGWINVAESKSETIPPSLLELLKDPRNILVVADPRTFKLENPTYAMVVTEKKDIPYCEEYLKRLSGQLSDIYKKYKTSKILNKKINKINDVLVLRFLIEDTCAKKDEKDKSVRTLQYCVPYGHSAATLAYSCELGQYKKNLPVFEDSVIKTINKSHGMGR